MNFARLLLCIDMKDDCVLIRRCTRIICLKRLNHVTHKHLTEWYCLQPVRQDPYILGPAPYNLVNRQCSQFDFLLYSFVAFKFQSSRGRLAQLVSQMNMAAMARVRYPLQTMNWSLYNVEIYDYTICGYQHKVSM